MLSNLVQLIEKSLLIYLCTKEKEKLLGSYDLGIGFLVKQCHSLSQQREQDIMHILALCHQAHDACDCQLKDDGTQDVLPFIVRLTNYLNDMPTGFIFATGHSALKEQVVNAIMLYDPRLLKPRSAGEMIVVEQFAYNQPLALHLKPDKNREVQDATLAEKVDILSENSKKQFMIMHQQKQSIDDARADIAKLHSMVEQKDIVINTLESKILALEGELWHSRKATDSQSKTNTMQSGSQFKFA